MNAHEHSSDCRPDCHRQGELEGEVRDENRHHLIRIVLDADEATISAIIEALRKLPPAA